MLSRLFDIKHWRLAVLICFVASMLVWVGDPGAMILTAVPLCGLYFLGVGIRTFLQRKRRP